MTSPRPCHQQRNERKSPVLGTWKGWRKNERESGAVVKEEQRRGCSKQGRRELGTTRSQISLIRIDCDMDSDQQSRYANVDLATSY